MSGDLVEALCGREDGVVGALAARGVAEGDWAGVWQAIIIDLFSGGPAWGDSSCAPAPFETGIDAFGARRDFARDCGGRSMRSMARFWAVRPRR